MNRVPTTAEKLRRLPWSILANATNAVFFYLTFFGSVFVLFLSELDLSKTQIGALVSLLPFAGLIALFIAPMVARFGYKRTYLVFHGGRKLITILLLFTPWVLSRFGPRAVAWYIVGTVAAFSLCRAVSVTAVFPWIQEYVPSHVQGKYSAINQIFWSLASFLAVMLGGYMLGPAPELGDFVPLFAIGVFFGLISLGAAIFIPGGAPISSVQTTGVPHRDMVTAARDGNFVRHLAGVGLTLLATGPLVAFLPLYLRDQAGLDSGSVVWLQAGTLLGALSSSYVWGWAADRYGSKPVMASGAYLLAVMPLFWWLMPREVDWRFYLALAIAFFQGIATLGWQIGSARLLFVNVVPPERNISYLALYYAWIGIVEGLGQLLGGRALDISAGVAGQFLFFPLDPYSILFAVGFVLPLMNALLLRGIRTEGSVGVATFAGFFLRGNPLRAAESLIRYHWARDEHTTVSVTERLGQARSPLTVDELLEALADPRFYVRFEAIISIARRGPDPRLTDALVKVLHGTGPALSVIAAWALGRIGDPRALAALREGLNARYRSVQAHCARSLGSLGDTGAVPLLLERLQTETDEGLKVAFASALGALKAEEATVELLDLLRKSQDEDARMELALALARLVGNEPRFIQLWRQMRTEPGTASSQVIMAIKKRISRCGSTPDLMASIEECVDVLAWEDLERGTALITHIIPLLPQDHVDERLGLILHECAGRLHEFGATRLEYVMLALHILHEGS